MKSKSDINNVQEPITQASDEVKQIIERVLRLEKDRLHQKSPRKINDDILQIIKEIIQ